MSDFVPLKKDKSGNALLMPDAEQKLFASTAFLEARLMRCATDVNPQQGRPAHFGIFESRAARILPRESEREKTHRHITPVLFWLH